MEKLRFSAEVEKRLTAMFRASKDGFRAPSEDRHRLEGVIQAGMFMGLVNKEELQVLMERIHVEIFGKTLEERQAEEWKLWPAEGLDYSRYEQPTFERTRDQK